MITTALSLRERFISLYSQLEETFSLCDEYQGELDYSLHSYQLRDKEGYIIFIPQEDIVRQVTWEDLINFREMTRVWVPKGYVPSRNYEERANEPDSDMDYNATYNNDDLIP